MILVSITFFGYIAVVVVSIVGFVIVEHEGNFEIIGDNFGTFPFYSEKITLSNLLLLCFCLFRLGNEQRASIVDYFRVCKVIHFIPLLWRYIKSFFCSMQYKVVELLLV